MNHDYSEGCVAGGYWIECSCGWISKYHQTLKSRRKARVQHDEDVENQRLWYVIHHEDGLRKPPYATKKEALRHVGVTSSTKLAPGRYAAAGGFTITTDPRVVAESTPVLEGS